MKLAKILSVFVAALLVFGALSITASAAVDEVVYENDFSDPATLADFTSYIVDFEIKDGKLWVKGPKEGVDNSAGDKFGFLIYNKGVTLKDYKVEADISDPQTMAGLLARCDLAKASATNANSFAGIVGFLSNDVSKGAIGRTSPTPAADGTYSKWGGNYDGSVIDLVGGKPAFAHVVMTVQGDTVTVVITNAAGAEIYNHAIAQTDWSEAGAFGVRVRLQNGTNAATSNVGVVAFDNLKVTSLQAEGGVGTGADTPAPTTPTDPAPTTPTTPATGSATVFVGAVAALSAVAAVAVLKKRKEN